jgi:cytochrome c-type biogenesis protein CcmH/NrfG
MPEAEKLKLFFKLPEEQVLPTVAEDPAWSEKVRKGQEKVERDPKDAAAWMELGRLYFKARKKEEALQCFDQVLRLRPTDEKLRDWLERYRNHPSK